VRPLRGGSSSCSSDSWSDWRGGPPLILVVEDIHWADRSTRDLLAFLARTLRAERIIIATHRTDEVFRGHPLRTFLPELYRARAVQRLELRPFTREEVADQLAAITGARVATQLVDSVFERSEGNAFTARSSSRCHPSKPGASFR